MKAERAAPLPLNGRGYLSVTSEKHIRWTIQFNSFDGDVRKLSYVDSSCSPWMQFVSPSQFVVFSCRGADDKVLLSAFDFSPQEMWEEPMGTSSPTGFLYAQQAGRFAMGRTTTSIPMAASVAVTSGSPGKRQCRAYPTTPQPPRKCGSTRPRAAICSSSSLYTRLANQPELRPRA